MKDNYDNIQTEKPNPRSAGIDRMTPAEQVRVMLDENRAVDKALFEASGEITAAVELISERMRAGGDMIYVGAGTSGRLGVIDAAECPPTFGVDPGLVRGIIAGGDGAVFRSAEGAEDSFEGGMNAIDAAEVRSSDVVVGISASGRAPYVIGALKRAGIIGAATVGVCCSPGSAMAEKGVCDVLVTAATGPEVIAGSTRLKAGTATKIILNIFSTCAMINTGRVRGNLMINVRPSNEKLRERAVRMIVSVAGCSAEEAAAALDSAGDVPGALSLLEVKNADGKS